MSFRLVLLQLKQLIALMLAAEELGTGRGEAKKTQVIQGYCGMLDELTSVQKKRLPGQFTDPQRLSNCIDFLAALGNTILGKMGARFLEATFKILPAEKHGDRE